MAGLNKKGPEVIPKLVAIDAAKAAVEDSLSVPIFSLPPLIAEVPTVCGGANNDTDLASDKLRKAKALICGGSAEDEASGECDSSPE